jgi:hypothetical protein
MTRAPAPYAPPPKVKSGAWISRVGTLLRDGYGSEDIAILLDCHPQHVLGQIAQFRREGLLNTWFKK